MLLNCFSDLHYLIDVQPHYLRGGKLKTEAISSKIVDNIRTFIVDFCRKVDKLNNKDNIVEELKEYAQKFCDIRNEIIKEIPNKKGNMLSIPAEYMEMIYIVSYYLADKLQVTQEEMSVILGIEKGFKNKFGISPAVDCKAYKTAYTYKLPIDERKEYLDYIIPLIGKVSANISNSYFVSLSNDLSVAVNVENNNRSISNSMQMFYNIKDNDDIYKWVFYENLREKSAEIKKNILGTIDTNDKEMIEEIFVNALKWGINIRQENLKESSISKFQLDYDDFLACIEKRDWFITARDDETYDDADIFNVAIDTSKLFNLSIDEIYERTVDRVKYCEECIDELNRSIDGYIRDFVNMVDFSTLSIPEPAFIEYIVDRYSDDLFTNPKDDLFLDVETYCMKYFIIKFFNQFGVSLEAYNKFKEYIDSADLREYVTRYTNVNCHAFSYNEDIIDKSSIWSKFDELKEAMHSGKEKRNYRTALVYIDLNDFQLKTEEILKLMSIDKDIHFIISSMKKLDIPLSECKAIIDNEEYYIYVSERTEENE